MVGFFCSTFCLIDQAWQAYASEAADLWLLSKLINCDIANASSSSSHVAEDAYKTEGVEEKLQCLQYWPNHKLFF